MACHHPLRAYRTPAGVSFKRQDDLPQLALPCGGCLGCRMAKAEQWAIRCALESQRHETTSFVTLTYDDAYLPPTLSKPHFSTWLKRLRSRLDDTPIRFFGCGEYGERTSRAHYHALVFGLHPSQAHHVQDAWAKGHTRIDYANPARIAYCAGYVVKKQQAPRIKAEARVDPETGEAYTVQPPFALMSRRPGIGAHAREHWRSWAEYAVWQGRKAAVPRYLRESFKAQAHPTHIEEIEGLRYQHRLTHTVPGYDHTAARAAADHTLLDHIMSRKQL